MVEGIEKDQLLVRYCNVDSSEPEREFSFVIDVSDRVYKGKCGCNAIGRSNSCMSVVLTSSPPLPPLALLVDTLIDTRDVYEFIRQVRAAYEAQAKAIL